MSAKSSEAWADDANGAERQVLAFVAENGAIPGNCRPSVLAGGIAGFPRKKGGNTIPKAARSSPATCCAPRCP